MSNGNEDYFAGITISVSKTAENKDLNILELSKLLTVINIKIRSIEGLRASHQQKQFWRQY